jgi:hypothetical protein
MNEGILDVFHKSRAQLVGLTIGTLRVPPKARSQHQPPSRGHKPKVGRPGRSPDSSGTTRAILPGDYASTPAERLTARHRIIPILDQN